MTASCKLKLTTTTSIPCPESHKVQQPTIENAFNLIVPVWLEIQQWPQQTGPDEVRWNCIENVENL